VGKDKGISKELVEIVGKYFKTMQLDGVLKFFLKLNGDIHEFDLYNEINKSESSFKINQHDLSKVLTKLIKDGYIIKNTSNRYSITWEGELFISEQNGYFRKEIEFERAKKELEMAAKQVNNTYRLTWALVVWGFFASLYYLAELLHLLLKFLHHCE